MLGAFGMSTGSHSFYGFLFRAGVSKSVTQEILLSQFIACEHLLPRTRFQMNNGFGKWLRVVFTKILSAFCCAACSVYN